MQDLGPANINLKTACDALGKTTVKEMDEVAKSILTYKGSAEVLSIITPKVAKELAPFISSRTEDEKVQIITNYLREGEEAFWERLGGLRKMPKEQVDAWRSNPDGFRLLDGNKPADIDGGKPYPSHYKQVRRIERAITPHG